MWHAFAQDLASGNFWPWFRSQHSKEVTSVGSLHATSLFGGCKSLRGLARARQFLSAKKQILVLFSLYHTGVVMKNGIKTERNCPAVWPTIKSLVSTCWKSYAFVIARCLTKMFATSLLYSMSWAWGWQSTNVLLTFILYVPSPVLLNGNKMLNHLLHKANSYYVLSLSRQKSVFVITGASPAS